MRTQTLLLAAAAALAAGILTSQAQPVYSANVVGYVNLPLTSGALSLVAPALDLDGTGTNNTISTVFPNPAIGDTVFAFNGSGYDTLVYTTISLGGHPPVTVTNWALGVTVSSNYPINPGQSIFYLPSINETNTVVGTVLQGTNLVNAKFPAAGNIQLLSSEVPISGGLTSVLGYNPTIGDTVYIYTNGAYNTYQYTTVSLGGHPPVTVTNWALGVTISEPVINVGQGFWMLPAANTNWTQDFIVQ
jgi:hypothetical protein